LDETAMLDRFQEKESGVNHPPNPELSIIEYNRDARKAFNQKINITQSRSSRGWEGRLAAALCSALTSSSR
jgi:hypothetical protein